MISSSQLAQAEILYSGVAAGDATNTSAILWTRAVDETTQQGIVTNLTAQVSTEPQKTLLRAQTEGERWKLIAISSPINEVGDDGGKSWVGGYRAERNELLKFIADNHINNVVFLSTDDHQNRINELTYFTNPSDPNSRTRVPNTFTIVAGPIGAGGPDSITDHKL